MQKGQVFMQKLLFVYNPNSGKGIIRKEVSNIVEKLSAAGYRVEIYPTAKTGDAAEIVKNEACNYDLLVVAGGDGTLNEAAGGLMTAKEIGLEVPVVGYIPVGTINDFATSLEIPKDVDEAVDVVINGKNVKVDIGSFSTETDENVRYFTYVAAFGAFTEVSYETSQDVKNVIGKAAYFLEGVKSFQKIRPYRVKVRYGATEIEEDFIFGMIANSKSVGGFKGITGPSVCLDDGKFDAIFIKEPKSTLDLQDIINSFILMDTSSDNICHFHASEIVLEPDTDLQWTLDGEAGGTHRRTVIKAHRQSIEIRVKKDLPKL